MIEENRKKAQKKREKKGTSAEEINRMATKSTRNVGNTLRKSKKRDMLIRRRKKRSGQAQESAQSNAKPGSLTSKAYLVSRYNSGTEDRRKSILKITEDKADKAKR